MKDLSSFGGPQGAPGRRTWLQVRGVGVTPEDRIRERAVPEEDSGAGASSRCWPLEEERNGLMTRKGGSEVPTLGTSAVKENTPFKAAGVKTSVSLIFKSTMGQNPMSKLEK